MRRRLPYLKSGDGRGAATEPPPAAFLGLCSPLGSVLRSLPPAFAAAAVIRFSLCSYSDRRMPARTGQVLFSLSPSLPTDSVSTSMDRVVERGLLEVERPYPSR